MTHINYSRPNLRWNRAQLDAMLRDISAALVGSPLCERCGIIPHSAHCNILNCAFVQHRSAEVEHTINVGEAKRIALKYQEGFKP